MDSFNGTLPRSSKENRIPSLGLSKSVHFQSNSLSSTSTQGFSLKDILSEETLKPHKPNKKPNSSNSEALNPQFLFACKRPKSSTFQRKSLVSTSKSIKFNKKTNSIIESEELNSTRSYTSQSRRFSDYEVSRSLVNMPKIKFEYCPELIFCEHCDKMVETTGTLTEPTSLEGKIMHFVSLFFACWEPRCAANYKPTVCEECGQII